jgi:Mlc titration factor MtfA (ptsG expression regulator)
MFGFLKGRRRKKLKAAQFPAEWLEVIESNVALFRRLPEADRRELIGDVQVFLAEKRFEGCGGLELSDEIRLTVAAQACLLLLHRRTDYFPRLLSIIIYPTSFVAKTVKQEGPGMVAEGHEARLGEAWLRGPLVLSWDDVLADAAGSRTGSNVVLHEFAHELDDEDGEANGAPALERGQSYADWARVLGAAYEKLRRDIERGHPSVLDDYGAESPAEFFAVATECFFEMPVDLQIEQPELYAKLEEFFRQDPASWKEAMDKRR